MSVYYYSTAIGYNDIPHTTTLNIYTVGCKHHCNGCHTPDLQDFNINGRKELTISDLDKVISRSSGLIKGICWLGGDPLYQRDQIIPLFSHISEKYPKLFQVVFTGYVFEGFHNLEKQSIIQSGIDYLIDGKYNGYPLGHMLCNQRVYHFCDKKTYNEVMYTDLTNLTK